MNPNKGMSIIDSFNKLIREYELGGTVRWILENNQAQALPYHNFNHSLYVMHYANKAYRDAECCPPPKELLVAALFHDFGHGGGVFVNDRRNIELAVDGFVTFNTECKLFGNQSAQCVRHLIRATEYPHKPLNEFNIRVAALRDADMMQNCNETLLANYVGIKSEMFRHLSYAEYTQKTIEFLQGIKYETSYGQRIGQVWLDYAISRMKEFQALVFD